MSDSMEQALSLMQEEYGALKKEQANRIGVRDNLLYFMLGSVGTIATVAAVTKAPATLLLLPLAAVILGWTYLANDIMVSAIGRYLRDDLSQEMRNLVGDYPLLRWENDHRDDVRRRERKRIQLSVDLSAFTVPPLLAVIIFWTMGPVSVWLVLLSLAELAAVGFLAYQMVVYAER